MGFRHFDNAPGDSFGWVHGLFTLLVVAAIVAGVVLIARQWRRPAPPPAAGWSPQSPAIHELDLRYARGEVERTEYLQRRADILGTGGLAAAATPDPPPS
jgi:putative membrane protein